MPESALLPSGFYDILTEQAALKSMALERISGHFQACGYDPVYPPLVEGETTLFAGSGKALENQTFRFLDPLSRQMVGVRADITPQISRIATTRLANLPKPLRLSYVGEVLSITGQHASSKRQQTQAGIELIDITSPRADADIVLTMVEALEKAGVTEITLDFTLPRLTPMIMEAAGISLEQQEVIQRLLDKKDIAGVTKHGGKALEVLTALASSPSDAGKVCETLDRYSLPQTAKNLRDQFKAIIGYVKAARPTLVITADLVEYRGFEYHTGVCFSLFSTVQPLEIARGGRYLIESTEAVGGTLYVDTLLRVLPSQPSPKRVYVTGDTPRNHLESLQQEHHLTTVMALDDASDPKKEAKRLGCDSIYQNGKWIRL
ncbi:MAG: phosphoribosyltransferase regulatory subunit [Rickettsiales bacterium]|nr:phosphoribosyltransferase regulatory subunit [Rickettsiales bacterium]